MNSSIKEKDGVEDIFFSQKERRQFAEKSVPSLVTKYHETVEKCFRKKVFLEKKMFHSRWNMVTPETVSKNTFHKRNMRVRKEASKYTVPSEMF